MKTDLLASVETFQSRTGLSDHRVGMLLGRDGRLLERLRSGRRVWPEKAQEIRGNIASELKARGLSAGQSEEQKPPCPEHGVEETQMQNNEVADHG